MAFLTILTLYLCIFSKEFANGADVNNFYSFYSPLWGLNHLIVNPQGTDVQLLMDKSSGAGFTSKLYYGFGLFHIKMKIPEQKTGGVVTNFYLTSLPDFKPLSTHFEINFEFLGTNGSLQTNVYNNDDGHREQTFKLWFDPSEDFHTYEILWNSRHIVFLVDRIPIRVFKNNIAHGIAYPSAPMHIEVSIWNADWAGQVDWTQAPFISHYRDFHFDACSVESGGPITHCADARFFWNKPPYLELSAKDRQIMQNYRKLHMTYDYCANKATWKKECDLNI